MDFDAAVAYMDGLIRFGIKLGNERFEALMERLGNPHRRYGVAHVAGTKGKGSTTAMIAAILHAHGCRTGGYYSPYVYDVRERVQVDGELIPRDDFARLVTDIVPHADALGQTELGQVTEFEVKTAVGFQYFAERQVEFAGVEVGLGGRLDATNIVEPLATVITNIGLDHTAILGTTHAKIAAEKAGIIKPGVPLVTATDEPSALRVIRRTAAERGAPLRWVTEGSARAQPGEEEVHYLPAGDEFVVRTHRQELTGLRLRLGGEYQRVNASCAVAAVEDLALAAGFELRADAVREGLATAYVPGRLEVVRRNPTVILDGAHNALAARALAREVQRIQHERLLLVVGMIAGHHPDTFLAEIAPLAAHVYATQPTWRRGLPVDEIACAAREHTNQVTAHKPPLAAARAALREARPNDLVLVTGSFYVVGDVRPTDLSSF